MHVKIKALLHAFAAVVIFFLTDSFCNQMIKMVIQICSSAIALTACYTCLGILNVCIAVFFYAKYVLRRDFSEIYLGKPYLALWWCIVGVMLPVAEDMVSFIFTKGELGIGCSTWEEMANLLFHEVVSTGIRTAVVEGMLFQGLLFCVLQKGFGKKGGIVASGFFYAAASFVFDYGFSVPLFSEGAEVFGSLFTAFLKGTALACVACETGSVWPSVAIHSLYNAFCGDAYILHIGTRQDFPAILTYTIEDGGMCLASLQLPSMVVFAALIIIAVVRMKKKGVRRLDCFIE